MERSFDIEEWKVWPGLNRVDGPDGSTHVEPRVMACLELLVQRRGQVVSKQKFFEVVWDGRFVVDDALVHCISVLRRALRDTVEEQRVIQTITKKGYRLVAPVEGLEDTDDYLNSGRSRLTLNAVLSSCSDHIYVYNRDHQYLFASEAGAQALGLEPNAMIGRCWQELGMPEEIMRPFHEKVAAVFSGAKSIRRTISYPTIYGQQHYEYILDPIVERESVVAVLALVRELA